jgi:hypothetical protein
MNQARVRFCSLANVDLKKSKPTGIPVAKDLAVGMQAPMFVFEPWCLSSGEK